MNYDEKCIQADYLKDKYGINVADHVHKHGITPRQIFPLYAACRGQHEAVVRMLVEQKADVTMQTRDGQTALWMSSWMGNANIVRILLHEMKRTLSRKEMSEIINRNYITDSTPLRNAVKMGNSEVVSLLLDAKADVHKEDRSGSTVLHIAAAGNDDKCVALLTKHGASINVTNKDGLSPLAMALRNHSFRSTLALVVTHSKKKIHQKLTHVDKTSLLNAAANDKDGSGRR